MKQEPQHYTFKFVWKREKSVTMLVSTSPLPPGRMRLSHGGTKTVSCYLAIRGPWHTVQYVQTLRHEPGSRFLGCKPTSLFSTVHSSHTVWHTIGTSGGCTILYQAPPSRRINMQLSLFQNPIQALNACPFIPRPARCTNDDLQLP